MLLPFIAPFRHLAGMVFATSATTTTDTSDSITCPTVQVGDLIVHWDSAHSDFMLPSNAIPANFVQVGTYADSADINSRWTLSYHVVTDAGLSGDLLHGLSGTVGGGAHWCEKLLLVFRGVSGSISQVTPSTVTHQEGMSIGPQTITSGSGTVPLVALALYSSDNSIGTRTFTPAAGGEITTNNGECYLLYKIYGSSPADITVDYNASGSNFNYLGSCYIQVK